MTDHATVDFETTSDAGYAYDFHERKWRSLPGFDSQKRGLKAVGVHVYVEHYSFRPLMLAYKLPDGTRGQWEWGEPFDVLVPLFRYIAAGGIVEASNAGFERTVWNKYCVPVWDWPPLRIEQMRCSAVKCRAAGYPGALEHAARVLQTPIQKDPEGERLMKIFSMPRNPTKKDPRTHVSPRDSLHDFKEWQGYKGYNVTDIDAESQVSERVTPLPAIEQEYWILDQEINDRGVAVDVAGIKNCIAIVEQAYQKYGAEHRELTGGIEPSELQQMRAWLAARGVDLPNMQAETVEAATGRLNALSSFEVTHELAQARRALQIRALVGSASVKKLYALDARVSRDGRVADMYMMHSTHHGRTGGYGPQPSNLYSGEWHEPAEVEAALRVIATRSLEAVEAAYPKIGPLDVVNNCLRSLFIAAPDHMLVSSDYSAIEGVVLAALAGEEWRLEVFRTHGMIYEACAARMTNKPFEEYVAYRTNSGGVATYDEAGRLMAVTGGKHHPDRKPYGKIPELASGYASWIGGWKKFGAEEFFESDWAIKQAILSWRDASPAIVEFWGGQTRDKFRPSERQEYYGLEGAAIRAVLQPGTCYRVGLIAFQMQDDCLYMQLPSGRLIHYHAPRLTPATRAYASPWELALSYEGWNSNPEKGPPAWIRMDLYGGVLTQNATGGTARDIMQHGMLNAKRAGYRIVMQTYDEAVAEQPIGHGSVSEFEACLNDLPAYAKGWPIYARGGWMGARYGKWD